MTSERKVNGHAVDEDWCEAKEIRAQNNVLPLLDPNSQQFPRKDCLKHKTRKHPNAKVLKNDVKQIPHYMNDAYIFGDSLQVNYFDIYFYDYLIPPCPSPRCKERTPEQLVEILKRE